MVANLRNVDDDLARAGRRRARARRAARRRAGAARRSHRPAAVAGAEHPRQRPDTLRRSQARRAGHRRRRRRAPRRRFARPLEAEGDVSSSSRPKVGGVTPATAPSSPPTRRSMADRRCSTTPCAARRRRTARRSWRRTQPAPDFVADAHAHCKFIGYVAAATPCWRPRASPPGWTTASWPSTPTALHSCSSGAAICGSGSASRWYPPCNDCTAVIMSPVACAGEIWCRRSLERPPTSSRDGEGATTRSNGRYEDVAPAATCPAYATRSWAT